MVRLRVRGRMMDFRGESLAAVKSRAKPGK